MNIKDKLRTEIRSGFISLQPNRTMITGLLREAGCIVAIVIGGIWYQEKLGQEGTVFFLILIGCIILHLLCDLLFRIPVRYIFDKHNNSGYRENLFLGKRRLMSLEEAIIFTHSESGDWHYHLGLKKKQFLRSYKISAGFGFGKASRERARA